MDYQYNKIALRSRKIVNFSDFRPDLCKPLFSMTNKQTIIA
ncbi:hypothetical protein PROSTU_04589 [Providencia stuartii ATCC 25827]|uniref:Uncharacterized protein n=1 Tax=Providencia stuartii ATCC 25827 TaxID=471874 RepID=A0AA87CNX9_PROST|nr:hypothetical protein PROSTU_04589 [Providencia stuartii ATCC 25827]